MQLPRPEPRTPTPAATLNRFLKRRTYNLVLSTMSREPDNSDYFGYAVSLSANGHTLAVGALYEDGKSAGINGDQASGYNTSNRGAAYLY